MNPAKNSTSLLLILLSLIFQLDTVAQKVPATNQAACLRAVYQLDYNLDSVVTTPKRVLMILRISNGTPRFGSAFNHISDSVYTNSPSLGEMERIQKAMDAPKGASRKNEFHYTILKTPAKGFISYHDDIAAEDYQYQENQLSFPWRITPAKKTIAGHECQQAYTAFGGRMWEAWFARDIAASDGPYKFYGLPGLILQIRDTHDHYVFSLLCLDVNPFPFDAAADTRTPMSIKSSAPIIKKAKFLQAKYNDDVTFMDRMIAHGNQVPEGLRQNHVQMIKRRNNPLELK